MSPRTRVSRGAWVEAMLGMMDQGLVPAEISLTDLSRQLGMTKGSFYSHFGEDRRAELLAAVISEWRSTRIAALPETAVGSVRDPLDRLRMIRAAAAATAVRDGAMRRWAASKRPARDPAAAEVIEAAAAAVDEVDRIVTGYLVPALVDLGFTGDEPAALAALLSAALREPVIAGEFEVVLGVLARAAAYPQEGPPGEGGAGRELTTEERRTLQRIATRLLAADTAAEELPPAQGHANDNAG